MNVTNTNATASTALINPLNDGSIFATIKISNTVITRKVATIDDIFLTHSVNKTVFFFIFPSVESAARVTTFKNTNYDFIALQDRDK